MATAAENLWPENIVDQVDIVRTPVGILQQQANILASQTKGLVTAEVAPSVVRSSAHLKNQLAHSFSLVVPALNNYQFDLLRIQHGPKLYPVEVYSDALERRRALCSDEQSFVDTLRVVLQSDETKKVLQSLISQARDYSRR